ncbi:hypothetical protein FNV43_RR14824 [Rhamnella rubrinervis]|uniref:Uncharacterized protein n=1 Tax=Rhamnella rubrinervis TaxID=2594499 RepID=A0A8K0MGL0_9ROSA|nr:hypothetical protein FNV43_RR14824 [Rhamnella rubrinervis]
MRCLGKVHYGALLGCTGKVHQGVLLECTGKVHSWSAIVRCHVDSTVRVRFALGQVPQGACPVMSAMKCTVEMQ